MGLTESVRDHNTHCMKSVRIWSYSGPHFSTFGLNTERYSVSLRIQSECGKMRTRVTPNTNTFLRSDWQLPGILKQKNAKSGAAKTLSEFLN